MSGDEIVIFENYGDYPHIFTSKANLNMDRPKVFWAGHWRSPMAQYINGPTPLVGP